MKNKIALPLISTILLTGCATAQVSPQQEPMPTPQYTKQAQIKIENNNTQATEPETLIEASPIPTKTPTVPVTPSPTENPSPSSFPSSSPSPTSSEPKTEAKAQVMPPNSEHIRELISQGVQKFSWNEKEEKCVVTLWIKESSLNPFAQNPTSSAYGIPQALPGKKMESEGKDWRTNPVTQISWGLKYIKNRYGTPCQALSHSDKKGWY